MLAWIPLIGWSFVAALEKARFRPIIQEISGQLLARPDTVEHWQASEKFKSLGQPLRSLIASEFGWPNDHFLPEDPFVIVFWAHRDGLDQVFVIQTIEKESGIEITADDLKALWRDGTFGDFVKLIASRILKVGAAVRP
jgi:hypothetical protein